MYWESNGCLRFASELQALLARVKGGFVPRVAPPEASELAAAERLVQRLLSRLPGEPVTIWK